MDQIHFDAADLPPEQAFDQWRVGVGDFELSMANADEPFLGTSIITSLAGVIISESLLPAVRFERTAAMALADGHTMWSLSLVLSGGFDGDADGTAYNAGPGEIALFSHTRPAEIRTRAGRTIVLAIPGDMLPGVDPARVHGILPAGPARDLLAHWLCALCPALPALDAATALPLRRALVAMIEGATAESFATGQLEDRRDRSLHADVMAAIQADLRANVSSAELCDALGVSRSALYRALSRDGGLRPMLRRLRLREAHRMLADPQETRSIKQIAHTVGYGDSASFSRHFAADFGLTAAAFRAAPEVPALIQLGGDNIAEDFLHATREMERRATPA